MANNKISQEIFDIVSKHFNNDRDKIYAWFSTPNPSFSYDCPMQVLKNGKENKLLRFVLSQMEMKI